MFDIQKRLFLQKSNIPKNAIWFHVASVGEFNSIKFLIDYISKYHDVFITYFSPRAKAFFEHQNYKALPIPLDLPFIWDKFLKEYSPKVIIFTEKEFWPFLLNTNIKKILLNARTPKNSLEKFFIKKFDKIIAKDDLSFNILKALNQNTILCGNIKLCIDIDCPNKKEYITIGSTHPKEEEIFIEPIKWILEQADYKIVLAPRHIDRANEVLKLLTSKNIEASLKSQNNGSRVMVLDTLGELKEYYKKSILSIVGGSFVKGYGGHNIAEPISFCSYAIYGPHIEKVEDIANVFEKMSVGFRVNAQNLINIIKDILSKSYEEEAFTSLQSYAHSIKNCYIKNIEVFLDV